MSTLPRQSGYILLTVVVMLAALMVLATQFLSRSGQSVQMSGYDRDAAEAAQLTESAMNFVYGQFTYGGDLNSDTIADNLTSFDPIKITTFTPPYLFYVSDLTSITSKTPSILQRIADGQSQDTKGTVNGARVPTLSAKLKVEDLFGKASMPILFSETTAGLVRNTTSGVTFEKSTAPRKAAVWVELVLSTDGRSVLFYAQSVGRVGNSISYVQRYMGKRNNTLGYISAVNEASP